MKLLKSWLMAHISIKWEPFALVGLLFCIEGSATCVDSFEDVGRQYGTGIELEIPLAKAGKDGLQILSSHLKLLDTEDTRIGSLFPTVPAPSWLDGAGVWRDLPVKLRIKALQEALYLSGAHRHFFLQREIPGLITSDSIRKKYPELQKSVELSSVGSPLDFLQLEYHLEYDGSVKAVDSSTRAAQFLKENALPAVAQHLHILRPSPEEAMRKEGAYGVFRWTDFYRRANQLLEMTSIVDYHLPLRSKEHLGAVLWDQANVVSVRQAYDFFDSLRAGVERRSGDMMKMAYLGIHSSDKYPRISKALGMQVRFIPKDAKSEFHSPLIDLLENAFRTSQFGRQDIAHEAFKIAATAPKSHLESWIYHQPWSALIQNRPFYLLDSVSKALNSPELKDIAEYEHKELKMLLHPWLKDPFLVPNLDAERLVEAQRRAVEKLPSTTNFTEIVRTFLLDSGIYNAMKLSFKSRPQR